jgi:hypothetical protein
MTSSTANNARQKYGDSLGKLNLYNKRAMNRAMGQF